MFRFYFAVCRGPSMQMHDHWLVDGMCPLLSSKTILPMAAVQRMQSLAKRRGGLARAHEQSLVNGGFLPLRGIDLPSRAYPWDCARRYR